MGTIGKEPKLLHRREDGQIFLDNTVVHLAWHIRNGTWKVVGHEPIMYIDESISAETSFEKVERDIGQKAITAGKPYDADYVLLSAGHIHIKEHEHATMKAYLATFYVYKSS